MIFASTPPINDDLTPYEYPSGVRSMFSEGDGMKLTYRPDPEFDRPRAHEANPVLVDIRAYWIERQPMTNPKGWPHYLRRFEGALYSNPWEANTEQIDHARRVLTRLANFA